MKCNLCGATEFRDYAGRALAQCTGCGSLERTRLLWMFIRSYIAEARRILHFAPEKGLYTAIQSAVRPDVDYVVADINPARYAFAKNVVQADMCNLGPWESGHYDVILHSHVLEHIPCNYASALFHIHRMLSESGVHIFAIPIAAGNYEESLQDIGPDERTRRFGIADHLRSFGRDDLHSHLGKVVRLPKEFRAHDHFRTDDLKKANIPERYWTGFQGCTVFVLRKNDFLLA